MEKRQKISTEERISASEGRLSTEDIVFILTISLVPYVGMMGVVSGFWFYIKRKNDDGLWNAVYARNAAIFGLIFQIIYITLYISHRFQ